MKKLIATFAVMLLCVVLFSTSCKEIGVGKGAKFVQGKDASEIFDEITEFEYKGHQWIWFKTYEGPYNGYAGGIVHDVDCWCGGGNSTFWDLEDDIDYD